MKPSRVLARAAAEFDARCRSNGFLAALEAYVALYDRVLNPRVPAESKRLLVVRESDARMRIGIGQQVTHMAKWLLLAMATERALFFQYCAHDGDAWLQPSNGKPQSLYAAPPRCRTLHYDLGHFFELLRPGSTRAAGVQGRSVDVRWTVERERLLRSQGLQPHVVSSCSSKVEGAGGVGSRRNVSGVYFGCPPGPQSCEASAADEAAGGDATAREAQLDFWASHEGSLPWLAFEYPAPCGREFGGPEVASRPFPAAWSVLGKGKQGVFDLRGGGEAHAKAHGGGEGLGGGGPSLDAVLRRLAESPRPACCATTAATTTTTTSWLLHRLSARFRVAGPCRCRTALLPPAWLPPRTDEGWGHCAFAALLRPSARLWPLVSAVTTAVERARGPLIGIHARTLALDAPGCFAPNRSVATGEESLAALDAAFSRSNNCFKRRKRDHIGAAAGCLLPWLPARATFDTMDALGGWSGVLRCAHALPRSARAPLRGLREPWRSGAVTIYLASDSEALDEMSRRVHGWRVLATAGPVAIPSWNNIALGAVGEHLGLRTTPRSLDDLGEARVMRGWLKAAADFFVFGLCDVLLRPVHSTFSESAALLAQPKVDVVGTFAHVCAMLQRAKDPLRELPDAGVRGANESAGLEACLGGGGRSSASPQSLVNEWVRTSKKAPDTRGTSPDKYDAQPGRATVSRAKRARSARKAPGKPKHSR